MAKETKIIYKDGQEIKGTIVGEHRNTVEVLTENGGIMFLEADSVKLVDVPKRKPRKTGKPTAEADVENESEETDNTDK